jgi:hypothetical protein
MFAANHLKFYSFKISMKEIDVLNTFYEKSFLYEYISENPDVKVVEVPKCSKYLILSNGLIYTKRCAKFLKPQTHGSQGWYYKVKIHYDDRVRNMRVHRLVAEAFLENPLNLPEVDHINHNRGDNRMQNLRWVTHKENMNNLTCHHNKKKDNI